MTDEDGGVATVTASVTSERRRLVIKGLRCGPAILYVESDELIPAIQALTEAAGLFVHEPDGCRGDCPCKEKR